MKLKKLLAAVISLTMTFPVMPVGTAAVQAADASELVIGDANGDGAFNVADIVTVQKWLVGSGELTCWENADLCSDNIIDVFDLCMMKNELLKLNNAAPAGMPEIIDDSGEITYITKSMIWQQLSAEYPDMDFSDFTFVYVPDHSLNNLLNGSVFSIYYRGILLHGYGNINTGSNAYAAVINTSNNRKYVAVNFVTEPEKIMESDTELPCIAIEDLSEKICFNINDCYVEKVLYVDVVNSDNLPVLAYRAVSPNQDYEYIFNASTGELIQEIPYYVV